MQFWRRRPSSDPNADVRIFYATDLHGSDVAFRKMLNSISIYGAKILICGGDLAGKQLYPIVDRGDGTYLSRVFGRTEVLRTERELDAARHLIESGGAYHVTVDPDEEDELRADAEKLDRLFLEKVRERLRSWVQLAEERLAPHGGVLYLTGGNDDSEEMLEPIRTLDSDLVFSTEGHTLDIGGYPMISVGWGNKTPWDTPREKSEDKLWELIEEAVGDSDDFSRAIFNFHVPPKDSTLDTCPALDTSSWPPKPVLKGGHQIMFGAGSSAVDEAIRRWQPLLGLHGHIHESAGVVRVGPRSMCLNAGSQYHDGVLLGALLTLRGDEVIQYQLTRG